MGGRQSLTRTQRDRTINNRIDSTVRSYCLSWQFAGQLLRNLAHALRRYGCIAGREHPKYELTHPTGSLQLAANTNLGADTITFDTAEVFATLQTIILTNGQLSIEDDVTIDGPGSDMLSVSGNSQPHRVFLVDDDDISLSTVDFVGMTVRDGGASGDFGDSVGAGIFNLESRHEKALDAVFANFGVRQRQLSLSNA